MLPSILASLVERFPPIKGVRWFNLAVLVFTPMIAIAGFYMAPFDRRTIIFSVLYFVFTMLGITAGYHRLWSHRSYIASTPLQLFLLAGGTSAVQGSCYWWARRHRSHHRHTDTELDPYQIDRGLLWAHIGWTIVKTDLKAGPADVSDLRKDKLVQFQHRWYFVLLVIFGYMLPTIIPGLFWGDWIGGFCFSGAFRLTVAHHSTFCINSIAHYLGSAPYDDKLSPRDHFLSAILTMGEGYHNFHHQFPMDYRNAYLWYQYDPTKWFIAVCKHLGLASNLRTFPRNEILKGAFTMKLKELRKMEASLEWPPSARNLPVIEWDAFQTESKDRRLVLISGFIHDVTDFVDQHPGGSQLVASSTGKDMTAAFFGGVYAHSNAAHNLLSMFRVAVLSGGMEIVPPSDVTPTSQSVCLRDRDRDIQSHHRIRPVAYST